MARGQGTADWGEQGLAAGAAAGIAFVSFGGGKREGCGREEPRLASSRPWWTFTKGDGGGRNARGGGKSRGQPAHGRGEGTGWDGLGEGSGGGGGGGITIGKGWQEISGGKGIAGGRDRRGEGSRGGGTGRALLAPEQKGSCLWRGKNRGGGRIFFGLGRQRSAREAEREGGAGSGGAALEGQRWRGSVELKKGRGGMGRA
ncbi:unnamed protein product [Calypogeia fissa]